MKKTTYTILTIVICLAVVAGLAFLVFHEPSTASRSEMTQGVGMGDVQRYNSQIPARHIMENNPWKASGMGDLRAYEAKSLAPAAGKADTQNSTSPGMGDLHRFEAQGAASP